MNVMRVNMNVWLATSLSPFFVRSTNKKRGRPARKRTEGKSGGDKWGREEYDI